MDRLKEKRKGGIEKEKEKESGKHEERRSRGHENLADVRIN